MLVWARSNDLQVAAIAPGPTGLFEPAIDSLALSPDGPNIIRSRVVTINYEQLSQQRIRLNLFPDAAVIAVRDRIETNASGSYSWIGTIEGMEGSVVVLVVRDEMVTGIITTPIGAFTIRPLRKGLHAILETDQRYALPPVAGVLRDYLIPDLQQNSKSMTSASASAADDGSIIDLMVIYTDDAADATLISEIEGAVAWTNQSYINSDINQRIWLTHTEEVQYDEEDPADHGGNRLSWDLNNITNANDGVIDGVHPTRNHYHADFTLFVVENADNNPNVCRGMAWIQDPINAGFENRAFATMESCLDWGQSVFTHELGHNMGARHDWYVDDTASPYTYAHGYVPTNYAFRTIMAYGSECSDQGANCPPIPNFSNPNITYNGQPTGVDASGPSNCTTGAVPNPRCQADNHSTLNNSAITNANFRSSEIVWTGAVNADWQTAGNWNIQEGPAGAAATVHRVPRDIDDIRIPPTANAPTISANASARDMLIENGAVLNMTGGVLHLYGQWEEQGSGRFNGSGGEIVFAGRLDQTITVNADSIFNHVTIGDGVATQQLIAASDLDIHGNLTIRENATFSAGNHTLRVAGDWSDSGRFNPGASTVIFDGASQNIAKPVSSATLIDEHFSKADGKGCGCSTKWLPDGWKRETVDGSGWYGGELDGQDGSAILWDNATDGWLFTTAVKLAAGVTYRISYDYRAKSGGSVDFSISYSAGQSSGSVIAQISDATSSNNVYVTQTDSFTVTQSGTYHLGIQAQKASGLYAIVDNVRLEALSDLAFYNLEIDSADRALLSDHNLAVTHDLTVDAGATLDLAAFDATVDGVMINNGTLRQTKAASSGATTHILRVRNSAGTADAYLGVAITPASDMGDVAVAIKGNQTSGCNSEDTLIHRCFDIAPAVSASATIRFWYLNSERNSYEPANMQVWHRNGGSWEVQDNGGEVRGAAGSYEYVEVDDVSGYSPFGLRGNPRPVQLEISIAGSAIQLDWTHSDSFVAQYQVWRAVDDPYAGPGDSSSQLLDTLSAPADVGDRISYTDHESDLANASSNDYYFIIAEDSIHNTSADANHAGEFDFQLVPGQP
jgi:hypothetical protein